MNTRPLAIIALATITLTSVGIAITEHRTAQEAVQEAAQQPDRMHLGKMEIELMNAKRDVANARNHSQILETEIDNLQNKLAEDAERLRYR